MSDIEIFSSTNMFLLGLVLLAPLAILLVLGWLCIAAEKRKAAKVFFYLGGLYVFLIVAIPLVLILIKG
jgi:hypothetical protein